ncbi:hypothetical protein [Spiroplasma endosymbiont of Ammophila pubescens]|uniref:hypothetical protein n=1 Tax=Spiroplasma endosymbiont of Ammophila pubescens TaxID=3066315 RepID=UPI0032B1E969
MKTLNLNDFVIIEGSNNKGKISVTNSYNDELAIDDPTSGGEFINYMRTRQIGIKLIPTESGKVNASFNQKTCELEIWDPAFKNNDITANFEIIKTIITSELKTTDDSLPTTKYINEHFQLKGSGSNDWELVDTSDFVSFSNKKYKIKNYDSTKYIYKIWIGINENNKEIINIMIETYKNHYEFNLTAGFLPIDINKNGEIISGNNKLMALHVERKK